LTEIDASVKWDCGDNPTATHIMHYQKSTLGKTFILRTPQWGLNAPHGHRVLCADGVIRACSMAQTADTFFSTPASIRIRGKSISGYVTTEDTDGISVPDSPVYSFRAHTGQDAPYWPSYDAEREADQDAPSDTIWERYREKHNAIVAKGR
jgi:hypothetical protein